MEVNHQASKRVGTAADDIAAEYLLNLPTTEQRRTVASVSRSELLAAVRALSGCQRCGFVEQVLAAFDPELSSLAQATLASCSDTSNWLYAGVLPAAGGAGAVAACVGVMAPTQVLALLSSSGCSSGLVGLLQFAWKDAGGSGDWLALSDSLLIRPRLLRRFLAESVGVMQALLDDVGDCRRHSGYPGPAELASTLARLDTQRCHTLQRLAAWGVLRAPTQPPPLQKQPTQQSVQEQTGTPRLGVDTAVAAAADITGLEDSSGDAELASVVVDDDLQLALAIQLSLRDEEAASALGTAASAFADASAAAPQPRLTTPSLSAPPASGVRCSPGVTSREPQHNHNQEQQQLQPQKHLLCSPSRRPQRTPPRPTGAASPGHSPAAAGMELGSRSPGSICCSGSVAAATAGLAASSSETQVCGTPAARISMSAFLRMHGVHRDPHLHPGEEEGEVAVVMAEKRREEEEHVAASPLPVAAALAAAEGMADATGLVDSAAVAALPEGLRERVQHLVTQLVQVQQRRGRLEHACQHGILAAGRKLLLILLQKLWGRIRGSAAAAAAAAAAVDAAAAPTSPSEAAGERGDGVGDGLQQQTAEAHTGVGGEAVPEARQPPPQQQEQQSRRRLPRYEGLLADLAAGLEEYDTHMDLDLDRDLDPSWNLGLDLDSELRDLALAAELAGGLIGGGRGTDGSSSGGAAERIAELVGGGGGGGRTSGPTPGTRNQNRDDGDDGGRGSGGIGGASGGGEVSYGGWDAALVGGGGGLAPGRSPAELRLLQPLLAAGGGGGGGGRHTGSSTATRSRRPLAFPLHPPALTSATAACRFGGGGGGGFGADCGGTLGQVVCRSECLAAREQQAEQLRVLQGQLLRCQASQSELQGEVGRLLDLLSEQRRMQEQATTVLRRDLAQWQAEPGALQGMGTDELAELAGRMEAALSRVRAAQLQAAAERDLLCPVCWELRKGLVFGCGHQTCCSCGEKLAACPICREPVSIRIRVYS
ncbi:hypothetical protein VOLCADRAFT_118112 [Volvox carteri f. nagariensis]|uniref:RING-type domain-containing protein n=1 Tax=Volvox carteri f. nagariensis TaxID=3068 RepID=D8U1W0_VOLCA|nr:uncharacterized protein VOLCADRAFT_118112 [Volvox carteri f. nagariensis]EFJ46248.1 hypothetical protein VOLCADRAFT_118112 [Volvox carteri f. nagariensis]|eukprot:XP_002952695.1 hypothetical protein VOLCADRAFT_118112 [Volvox carteri f. nagariensis]